MIYLHHAEIHFSAYEGVEVADGTDINLRAGKKSINAHEVNNDSSFNATETAAFKDLTGVERSSHSFPDAHEVGSLARQDELTVFVFDAFKKHLNLIADFYVADVGKLINRNGSFGLKSDIKNDFVVSDTDNPAFNDFTLRNLAERSFVERG
jgi:hypothetical protein